MKRTSFNKRLSRLKTGCVITWVINFLCFYITLQAAAIFILVRKHSTNQQIINILTFSAPICLLIAAIIMLIISHNAAKMLITASSDGAVEVTDGEVFNVVNEMRIAAGLRKMPKVYVTNSPVANAYAVSNRTESAIVFTQPLLNILNRQQLQAVAGHELGHVTSGDCQTMTTLVGLTSITAIISGIFSRMFYFRDDRSSSNSNPLAIALIAISFITLLTMPLVSTIARMFMSRERESAADALSVKYSRNPNNLATALLAIENYYNNLEQGNIRLDDDEDYNKKIKKFNNTVGMMAFWGKNSLMSTHPTTENRIKSLVQMGADSRMLLLHAK